MSHAWLWDGAVEISVQVQSTCPGLGNPTTAVFQLQRTNTTCTRTSDSKVVILWVQPLGFRGYSSEGTVLLLWLEVGNDSVAWTLCYPERTTSILLYGMLYRFLLWAVLQQCCLLSGLALSAASGGCTACCAQRWAAGAGEEDMWSVVTSFLPCKSRAWPSSFLSGGAAGFECLFSPCAQGFCWELP